MLISVQYSDVLWMSYKINYKTFRSKFYINTMEIKFTLRVISQVQVTYKHLCNYQNTFRRCENIILT